MACDLVPLLEEKGEVVRGDRPGFDIADIDVVRARLKDAAPDIVVNCAAYTDVDGAEKERELAFAVNGSGPGNLALLCAELKSRLVHISTDFVFDGEAGRPYGEESSPNPLSVYGRSKLEGERRVRETLDDHIIVRTSWLYGKGGGNFIETIATLAGEREELGVVYDQVGTPTSTVDLAEAIVNLIDRAGPGTYHFSNEGVCSWYDFAYEIVRNLRERGESLRLKRLRPILTEEYPTPATRPRYSVLDKAKYRSTTGMEIPHWREGVERYFEG